MSDQPSFVQFEIGSGKNFIYLLLDWESRCALIVDPQEDDRLPLTYLQSHQFTLKGILLTHTHWDHVGGVKPLLEKYPELTLSLHENDFFRLKPLKLPQTRIHFLKDGERISLGKTTVETTHTPGHSTGGCCYWIRANGVMNAIVTGDTLFIRDCGRTDLETGSSKEMFESIQKVRALFEKTRKEHSPDGITFLPGHHYASESTSLLETELRLSPPFQCKSVKELEVLP